MAALSDDELKAAATLYLAQFQGADRSTRLFLDDFFITSSKPIVHLNWRAFATERHQEQTGIITANPDDARYIPLPLEPEQPDDGDDD